MNTVQMDVAQFRQAMDGASLSLPMGLLGFEKTKRFVLHTVADDSPLLWLEVADSINKGFYALDPDAVPAGPVARICPPDLEFLGLDAVGDGRVLCLATVSPEGQVTVHRRAPIVINPRTWIGKQVVPDNVEELPANDPVLCPATLAA